MRRKLLSLTVAAITAATISSCATLFCGSKSRVVIDSNINEASSITIDGRKHNNVSFPFQTKIKRGFYETIVTAKAEGYDNSEVTIYKNFNAVSVINLLSILGWGIDAATGAMMKPEYRGYELEFKELK